MEEELKEAQRKEEELAAKKSKKNRGVWAKGADTDKTYDYQGMLGSIVEIINKKSGSDSGVKTTFKLPEITVQRTPTKSIWINFPATLEVVGREPAQVLSFFLNELGCDGAVNDGMMQIAGKFQPKDLTRIMRRYVVEYVQCQECKGY